MNYIIKNGILFGVYSNNYENLYGKPLINNVELAQGISYSSDDLNIIKGPMTQAEYDAIDPKNPQTIYVVKDDSISISDVLNYLDCANKPSINDQILTGNKSLASLDLYSREEVNNLISSLRSILVVTELPVNPVANTMYYVGTQSPYHVYLYDSNLQQIDLGSSEVDFSDYYKKAYIDETFYTKTDIDNKTGNLSNLTTTSKTNLVAAINEVKASDDLKQTKIPAGTAGYIVTYSGTEGTVGSAEKATSVSSSSTDDQIPTAKAVYDFGKATTATSTSAVTTTGLHSSLERTSVEYNSSKTRITKQGNIVYFSCFLVFKNKTTSAISSQWVCLGTIASAYKPKTRTAVPFNVWNATPASACGYVDTDGKLYVWASTIGASATNVQYQTNSTWYVD